MHGDHSFGLVPLLCALADGTGGVLAGTDPRDREALLAVSVCRTSQPPLSETITLQPPVEIYGLTGTRRLVRTTLECTYTHLARRYRVNEMLFSNDKAYGGRLHHNELVGNDLWINKEGCWPSILDAGDKMQVSAAPILHTVPCVGFIFKEPPRPASIDIEAYGPLLQRNKEALAQPPHNLKNPMILLGQLKEQMLPITLPDGAVLEPPHILDNGRKLVLLGDTYNAESKAMDSLAAEADILVHEATNAFLPGLDDAVQDGESYGDLYRKCRAHGHSTPQVSQHNRVGREGASIGSMRAP